MFARFYRQFLFAGAFLIFGRLLLSGAEISPASAARTGLKPPERLPDPQLRPASDEPLKAMAKFRVGKGFKVNLWAAEPMLGNPVAFTLDEKGNVFVAETYRYRTSALDIRHYMFMLEDDLASRTTDDRVANIKKNFPNEWQKLAVETEIVRRLEDSDGDGKADKSSVYVDGMNTLLDGINSGVLAHEGKLWCTNIPNLWLFSGRTNEGKAEKREVLSSGYGVRFSFTGHDLHGLIIGPDGRLYFSLGDRGAHVVTREGKTLDAPDEGAVFRCQLDGSHLEIVHRGLRNPQELAFDKHGNLFTGDNDSDQGDRERWVQIVEGGDSGWRVGYQHNPLGKEHNPWLAERMWEPRTSQGQPAFILSPILNIPDGPSGIVHYPGTGLPPEFDDHFFVCGFKGSSARSAITTLKVRENGAGFAVEKEPAEWVGGVQATDIDFGPDSRIYFSEWGEGWEGTGRGRIFRMEHTPSRQSQAAQIAEVQKLLGEGFAKRSSDELARLLAHPDQRVRLRAQWALAKQPDAVEKLLAAGAHGVAGPERSLARLHAIWGLGQLVRDRSNEAFFLVHWPGISNLLALLVKDADPEVRAQAAWLLGEAAHGESRAALQSLLQDGSRRVRFFAALALAKYATIWAPPAGGPKSEWTAILRSIAQAAVTLARENADQDEPLRHAAVMLLAACNSDDVLRAAAKDDSSSVRLAALLAMRRLEETEISQFLADRNPDLVREAARAINDVPISGAYGELGRLIEKPRQDAQLMLRVINANFRVGTAATAHALAQFAADEAAGDLLGVEALGALGSWAKPFPRDRVVGIFRPLGERGRDPAVAALQSVLARLLGTTRSSGEGAAANTGSSARSLPILLATISAIAQLEIKEASPALFELVSRKSAPPKARGKALETLAGFDAPHLEDAIKLALADKDPGLRVTASTVLGKRNPDEAAKQLAGAFAESEITEQKAILTALGNLHSDAADKALATFVDDLRAGKIAPPIQLELLEAAGKHTAPELKAKVAAYENGLPSGDLLAKFAPVLAGGDLDAGEIVFKEHPVAQCFRCHKINGSGGEAGPDLTGIGAKKIGAIFSNRLFRQTRKLPMAFNQCSSL